MKQAIQNGCDPSCLAVVLAGGLSQRFGSDKVYARFKEKFLIQMIVEKLKEAKFKVVLSVAKPKPMPTLETIPIIEDPFPFEGPLQAIYGALAQLNAPKMLFVACDMPFLEPKLIKLLWEESDQADIAVLEWKEKLYPLPGVYSKNIVPYVKELLNRGRRDLKSLFETDLVLRKVVWDRWQPLDPQTKSLLNVNNKETLKEVSLLC